MTVDYTLLLVLQGAVIFGAVAGMVGVFAILRQQSLLGDAISHAALPGIVMMFLLTKSKNPWILLVGGAIAGSVGTWMMHKVIVHTTLKKDAVLGILLSVFFGLGLVLMTVVQKYSLADQAILNKFLFGNVATLLPADIFIIKIISAIILMIVVLCYKEFFLCAFDPVYCSMLGFSVQSIEFLLTLLLVLAITVGLQTVGVVLMSTMIIAPAAAARQWTKHPQTMLVLAGFFGSLSAGIGVCASSWISHMPTGPMIVVVASGIVLISLLCAPQRGYN